MLKPPGTARDARSAEVVPVFPIPRIAHSDLQSQIGRRAVDAEFVSAQWSGRRSGRYERKHLPEVLGRSVDTRAHSGAPEARSGGKGTAREFRKPTSSASQNREGVRQRPASVQELAIRREGWVAAGGDSKTRRRRSPKRER